MLYNADDCFSTLSLRDWLERKRREQENGRSQHSSPVHIRWSSA